MGSVVAWKRCKKEGAPTVMIAAHMDEVGFMVQYVRDDGLIRYMTVGGIDPAVCVGKRVLVGKTRVPGVIGCKAVHLQERDERPQAQPALHRHRRARPRRRAQGRLHRRLRGL